MSKRRSTVMFVDAENIARGNFDEFASKVEEYGDIKLVTIIGSDQSRAQYVDVAHRYCVREIAVRKMCGGGQGADTALATEATESALQHGVRSMAILSGDTDFAYLLMKLKAKGVFTIAAAPQTVPQPYRALADVFHVLGGDKSLETTPPKLREVERFVCDVSGGDWIALPLLGTWLRSRFPALDYSAFGARNLTQMLSRFPDVETRERPDSSATVEYRCMRDTNRQLQTSSHTACSATFEATAPVAPRGRR